LAATMCRRSLDDSRYAPAGQNWRRVAEAEFEEVEGPKSY
jgi:hypothetical protein